VPVIKVENVTPESRKREACEDRGRLRRRVRSEQPDYGNDQIKAAEGDDQAARRS
jgi:hypothetical protein